MESTGKIDAAAAPAGDNLLPEPFEHWFAGRGWAPRDHQLQLLETARGGRSALLIAPTGGGKTLAGFLPSLIELSERQSKPAGNRNRLHTLYISPLKALAVDVARNLKQPIDEIGLGVSVETRTGDTPQSRRRRQWHDAPEILMTTPEQLALLLSHPDSENYFAGLRRVVLDELHALVSTKRGALLALGLARLFSLAPGLTSIGLSATVADPDALRAFLVPQKPGLKPVLSDLVLAQAGASADISILDSEERIPWSGHSAKHAYPEIYDAVRANNMVLVFVNTRSQAEMIFQQLWQLNEDSLPIALHHGSLDVGQRRKVEAAMADGRLRAVVCTSTLDLGIDWGDVDLVINVGAPKGASRLMQRIGRANHRLDEQSRALLVPANRFEVLECRAAQDAADHGQQDSPPPLSEPLDVLAQHVMGRACAAPFDPNVFYQEICTASIYAGLTREAFDRVVDFVATGGYALRRYDRYARLRLTGDGLYRLSHPRLAQQYRLNVGTIVEAPMLKVRLTRWRGGRGKQAPARGGRVLGEIEEWFIEQLAPGDTFLFAGHILRFEGLVETEALVTRSTADEPAIPSYQGGKFPLSTYLADRVRHMLANPDDWQRLPGQVRDWLSIQRYKSVLPRPEDLLVETFPRGAKYYMVCYPFEGRLAHQTLGMLLTRRLDRAGARPLGFVASEYALAVWGLRDLGLMAQAGKLSFADLFSEDMLGDDLEAWLAESSLMKRTFRTCATIAGLIERRFPGQEKSGRQMTVSSDLIYDVLREHEPDHILLRATWNDASSGLLDVERLGSLLKRIRGHVLLKDLEAVSPLAVPVMLEIGREPVYGEANEALLAEAADALIEEATRLV